MGIYRTRKGDRNLLGALLKLRELSSHVYFNFNLQQTLFFKKNLVTIRHIGDFSRAKMTGRTFGADIFDFSLLSQKLLKNSFDHLNSISSHEHICALRDKASFG